MVARDLRLPITGPDPLPNMQLIPVSAPDQDGYEDLVRMCRRMRMRRDACDAQLREGATGVLAYVIRDGKRHCAGMGWVSQAASDVPFLNARFTGAGRACMLSQDLVLPEFRGLKLQQVIGKYRIALAAQRGSHWAYGYIRRANVYSLRNAIEFRRVAIVHNLYVGGWLTSHVCALGNRTCDQLPFAGWPPRRWFYIRPRRF